MASSKKGLPGRHRRDTKQAHRQHRWVVDSLCGEEHLDMLSCLKSFELPVSTRGFWGPKWDGPAHFEFYDIEGLWGDAKSVKIETTH